jgi:hypothetical protein
MTKAVDLFGRCYRMIHIKEVYAFADFDPKYEPMLHNPYPKLVYKPPFPLRIPRDPEERAIYMKERHEINAKIVMDNYCVLSNKGKVFFILREGFNEHEFQKLVDFVSLAGTENVRGRLRLLDNRIKKSKH